MCFLYLLTFSNFRKKQLKEESLGFSLVELLIVIFIIGLIFSVGVANYRDFSRRKQVEAVANQVKSDLELAKQNALSGVKPDHVNCNSPNILLGYRFVVQPAGYTVQANCSAGGPLGSFIDIKSISSLPYGVRLSSNILDDDCTNPVNGDSIQFLPRGNGTNLSDNNCFRIRFSITGLSFTQDIIVEKSGAIR